MMSNIEPTSAVQYEAGLIKYIASCCAYALKRFYGEEKPFIITADFNHKIKGKIKSFHQDVRKRSQYYLLHHR